MIFEDAPEDIITVEDMNKLIKKVQEFYKEKGNPRLNVFWLTNLFLRRLKNDLDYYVNCEGQKGYGKSNLMLLLALMQARYAGIYKRNSDGKLFRVLPQIQPPSKDKFTRLTVDFSFNKNMSFLDNVQDIEKKYYGLDKYQSFVIDEGSKNLHKHRWMDALQFRLVQLSDIARYQNKTFFICFPNFIELNSSFRNNRIMMRLYVYHRDVKDHFASAIISLKDPNRYISDPWHTDDNAAIFNQTLKNVSIAFRNHNAILRAEKKMYGFTGVFDFPELKIIAPKIWNIYYKYKITNAQKQLEDEEENKDSIKVLKWKGTALNLIEYIRSIPPELSQAKLAAVAGLSTGAIKNLYTTLKPKIIDKTNQLIENDVLVSSVQEIALQRWRGT